MNMKYFATLHLPDYRDIAFENFLSRGIDFETNRIIEQDVSDELGRNKTASQRYADIGNDKYFCGFYESALKYYALALRKNQNEIDAWVGQIRVLIDCGRFTEALFWAEKGCMRLSGSENMELAEALALAHAGKIQQARALVNKPVKKNESPIRWLFRGEVMIKLTVGFFQKIIKPYKRINKIGAFFCFIKALESNPRDGFLNQRIGIAYLHAHDFDRAYAHLKTALITAPQNPLTLYCLADYYRRRHDYRNALYYTKKAIAFNPQLDAAIELLQWLYSPYGKFMRRVRTLL
ncbi:MAG: hypothetical protein JSV97_13110 [candidate division WOR-3 bacterium]|nr:MAG: hypothetical protein JSV97_13110 [candidate division WOR-3 bacterium]